MFVIDNFIDGHEIDGHEKALERDQDIMICELQFTNAGTYD